MNAFVIILGLVMLAFGILQIILFFKMWGMTGDVKEIKSNIKVEKFDGTEIRRLYLSEDTEKLKQALFNNMYYELIAMYKSMGYLPNFEEDVRKIKDYHKSFYKKYDIPFPEKIEALKNVEDFKNL